MRYFESVIFSFFFAFALLLGGAAVFRTTAWALHGAEFATTFVAVEAILTLMLLVSANLMNRDAS